MTFEHERETVQYGVYESYVNLCWKRGWSLLSHNRLLDNSPLSLRNIATLVSIKF